MYASRWHSLTSDAHPDDSLPRAGTPIQNVCRRRGLSAETGSPPSSHLDTDFPRLSLEPAFELDRALEADGAFMRAEVVGSAAGTEGPESTSSSMPDFGRGERGEGGKRMDEEAAALIWPPTQLSRWASLCTGELAVRASWR